MTDIHAAAYEICPGLYSWDIVDTVVNMIFSLTSGDLNKH